MRESPYEAPSLHFTEGINGGPERVFSYLRSGNRSAQTGAETLGHCCLVAQLCPTLCDTTGCSLPGSSIHGISQARILE